MVVGAKLMMLNTALNTGCDDDSAITRADGVDNAITSNGSGDLIMQNGDDGDVVAYALYV